MGRQQFFRGDPSLKQYYLIDDFTGGINNTSVDERTQDNEFRELLNVELSKKGMLQNRKGWGRLRLFNELLASKDITLPTREVDDAQVPIDRYALIQIVKNDGNLLSLIEEYDEKNVSITEFNSYGFNYDLEMILIYEDAADIKLARLEVSSTTIAERNEFEVIVSLAPGQINGNKPLTNLETVNYTDFVYFSLSQLSPGIQGFGEYNVFTKAFRFVRDDELPNAFVYKPNPYEATKIGFNVLSSTPLTDVRTVSTFLTITGVFLTTLELNATGDIVDTQTPIRTLPLSGRFTVNALYTGEVDIFDTVLEFYVFKNDENGIPQESKIPFQLLDTKQEDDVGVLRFAVSVDVKGRSDVFFRLKLKTGILFTTERLRTFDDMDDMIDYFNPDTNTKAVVYDPITKHYDVYNKTALNYTFEKIPGITYESVVYSPIYDDKLFEFTRNKKWRPSTLTAFNNQSNPALKTVFNTSTCAAYPNITETSLNGTSSVLPVNNYAVGHVVRVRKTSGTSTTVKNWANTTQTNFSQTRDLAENQFNSLTAATVQSVLGLNPANFATNTILRVRGTRTTTRKRKIFNTPDGYAGTPLTLVTFAQECELLNGFPFSAFLLQYEISGGTTQTFSAEDYPLFQLVSINNLFTCTPEEDYPNINNRQRVWRVEESDEDITETTIIGTKFYIVNSTTTSTFTDCSPFEEKFFIREDELLGTTAAVVTFDATENKFYYRFEEEKTEIVYTGTRTVDSITDLKPVTFGRYLLGSDPNSQTSYYRYLGTTEGDETDFEQITFSETVQEVEYLDNYLISEAEDLKKIEALDTKGFRILEIGSRLVYYKENIIWFSDLYQFDYIPNYNYIILPLSPNDRITGIIYFKGSYMIFTRERIYKMSGTFGGQDFQIQIVSDAIGCISPYSVKPFNNTLVFMTRDGLYRIKQNYYLGGLENVEKIDKQVGDIVPTNVEVYSALHNEQYFLFYKYPTTQFGVAPFNVVKMYYNMDAPQGYPFVKDKYSVQPNIIATLDDEFISISNGLFYMYDIGYTDFIPIGILTSAEQDVYRYNTLIRTSNLFFYYPTHDKKFKSILVKTNCNDVVPLYFNIWVDNKLVYSSQDFVVTREGTGTLTYNAVDVASLELQPGDELDLNLTGVVVGNVGALGQLDLGTDKLGDTSTQTHKIVFAAKGKNITVEVRQRLDKYFGIQDIGYVYKMGKAREDR